MPEKDFWSSVKARLRNYEEVPADDAWDKIAGAIPPPTSGTSMSRKAAVVLIIFLLGSLGGVELQQYLTKDGSVESVSEILQQESSVRLVPAEALPESNESKPKPSLTQKAEQKVGETVANSDEDVIRSKSNPSLTAADQTSDHVARPMNISAIKAKNINYSQEGDATQDKISDIDKPIGRKDHPRSLTDATDISENDDTQSKINQGKIESVMTTQDRNVVDADVINRNGTNENEQLLQTLSKESAERELPDTSAKIGSSIGSDKGFEKDQTSQQINQDGGKILNQKQNAVDSKIAIADSIKKSLMQKTSDKPDAQEPLVEKKPAEKKKKFSHGSLYAIITPSLSFQRITPTTNDDLEVIGFESPGVMSKERFGLSLDIGYEHAITKKLEWYAGLSFYQQKQTLSYNYYSPDEFDVKSNGNGGFAMTPKIVIKSFDYGMLNTGVSGGLRYTIKTGGLKHKFGAGLQFQRGLLKADGEQASYSNASASYFNYQLTYRLEINIRRRVDVFLQPSFMHSILANENLKEPFELRPYRAGVGLGVLYRF